MSRSPDASVIPEALQGAACHSQPLGYSLEAFFVCDSVPLMTRARTQDGCRRRLRGRRWLTFQLHEHHISIKKGKKQWKQINRDVSMSSMCSNPFVSLFLARSLSLSAPVSTFAAHPFSAPSPRVSYLSVLFFYWLLVTPVWCNKITFSSLPPSLPLSFPIQANLFILPSPSLLCIHLLYLFLFVSFFCHSLETYELIFLVSPSCISCPSLLPFFFFLIPM